MQDDEINLLNACTDLVSLKKWEAFPRRLLDEAPTGEWIGARQFCQQIGVSADDLTPALFVTWLPDPKAHDGYVVIMFYDDESKWIAVVNCNTFNHLVNRSASSQRDSDAPTRRQ